MSEIVKAPKVTVLISTYNRPQYLAEAIESVIEQVYQDWELIVLNDGGKDVADVVEKFSDSRIRYIPDNVNKGAAIRFNQGLKLAKGEYIAYLGDDDKFYPNHLKVLATALDNNPDIALAYSDLYAVSSVSDPVTGKRYALEKNLSISRNFNREFMFHFNHVLHVSLMHRKEAAFRVGCFDEEVKVLIEWSLNRRLAFLYDFLHVEEATGEYYMPVFKSDRISVRERRDQKSYEHNLRKIKSNLPAEPWTKVDRIDLLYVIEEWGEHVNQHLREIIDNFDHPFKIYLINNGSGLSIDQVKKSLGILTELKNISIVHIPEKILPMLAYRKAAKKSNAKFLFLVTPNLQAVTHPKRLFSSLEALYANPEIRAIRWDIQEEKSSPFNCLIYRDEYLKYSKPDGNNTLNMRDTTIMLPKGFRFDSLYSSYKQHYQDRKYAEAKNFLDIALAEKQGAPPIQFLIQPFFEVCMVLKDYKTLEGYLLELIKRDYLPDNLLRLGLLYKKMGKNLEAIKYLKSGLKVLNLEDKDFESAAFPVALSHEFDSFKALIALGDAYLELSDLGSAARYYHLAAKVSSENYKPVLGFGKLYLQANQLDRAEVAATRLASIGGKDDPETHRFLARLCQKKKDLPLAFHCMQNAFEADPYDELNIDLFYFFGSALNKWEDMLVPFENIAKENNPKALGRLASVYFNLQYWEKALECAQKCLNIEPNNPVAKSISERLKKSEFLKVKQDDTIVLNDKEPSNNYTSFSW